MSKGIEEVKSEWQDRLMAMPGVMAVGIGRGKDRRPCIQVTVDSSARVETMDVPEEIEGHKVEVRVRGPFKAL